MNEISLPHGGVLTYCGGAGQSKRPALLICPGGGYEFCSIREGAPVARAFARDGIASFVLEYGCEDVPLGKKPLQTLSAAVAWVRRNADDFGVDAERIAVCGFSAGGHLAAHFSAVWDCAAWFAPGTDLQAHRPNAALLCYPVITAGEFAHRGSFDRLAPRAEHHAYSVETLVGASMPPTFVWHTLDDETVPVENTLLLLAALRRAGVPQEAHLFPHGVHGLALADYETADPANGRLPDRHVARWQALGAEWLKGL